MKIDIIHLKNLFEYAKCRNLDQNIELPPPLVDEETKLISVEMLMSYFAHYYKESNDKYFGLHLGFFLSFEAMKVIYDISLTVSSVKQLTLLWKEYVAVSFPLLEIVTEEKEEEYSLIFKGDFPTELGRQILEAIIVFSYRELKIIIGTDLISLSIPNKNISEYQLWFDCPLIQGADYRITFNCSSDLNISNKKIRNRIEVLLPAFLYYLENLKKEEVSFLHQVKLMTLNLCEPNCPTIEQIAAQFCMSTRTLQRRLKREGTSYRTISNDLKKELYTYLENDSRLKTIDISYILGYSSSSAFLHALKSWGLSN